VCLFVCTCMCVCVCVYGCGCVCMYVCMYVRVYVHIKGVPLATETGIEDVATKFEQEYVRCVRNDEGCVCSVCL
jgi:hypothetical protein